MSQSFTLPELSSRELHELTPAEILRRTLDLKIEALRALVGTHNEHIDNAQHSLGRQVHLRDRIAGELAGWESLRARLDEAARPCSLCTRGEGCDGPC